MAVGTVDRKLEAGAYASVWHLARDILLTFDNAQKYNPAGHPIHKKAAKLSAMFRERFARMMAADEAVLEHHTVDPWPLAWAQILRGLLLRPGSWPFLEPVDPVALGIPDYHDVIKRPMDLGTVARRLQSGQYPNAGEVSFEVRLVVENAMTYNPQGHQVHQLAKRLGEVFEQLWGEARRALDARADAAEEAREARDAMRQGDDKA